MKNDEYLKNYIPSGIERGKYGGPQFAPSSKDYGNFVENYKIDQIIKNVRHMR